MIFSIYNLRILLMCEMYTTTNQSFCLILKLKVEGKHIYLSQYQNVQFVIIWHLFTYKRTSKSMLITLFGWKEILWFFMLSKKSLTQTLKWNNQKISNRSIYLHKLLKNNGCMWIICKKNFKIVRCLSIDLFLMMNNFNM